MLASASRRGALGVILLATLTSTSVHAEQPGLRAFVDPQTGELVPNLPTDGGALAARSETARTGFVEEAIEGPGGGFRVRLGSRFHMSRRVHVEPGGALHETCVPEAP